jgi:hypothetical protein
MPGLSHAAPLRGRPESAHGLSELSSERAHADRHAHGPYRLPGLPQRATAQSQRQQCGLRKLPCRRAPRRKRRSPKLRRLSRPAQRRPSHSVQNLSSAGVFHGPARTPSLRGLPSAAFGLEQASPVRHLPRSTGQFPARAARERMPRLPSPSRPERDRDAARLHDLPRRRRAARSPRKARAPRLRAVPWRTRRLSGRRTQRLSRLSRRSARAFSERAALRELSPVPGHGSRPQGTLNVTTPSACRSGLTNV